MDRISERVDQLFELDIIDKFLDMKISQQTSKKLLKYQFMHVQNLMYALQNNNVAIDSSDTGTGKTYTTLATCKELGLKPFIICPKSIIHMWKVTAKKFDVELLGVSNYEIIKRCKYYYHDSPVECPYLSYNKTFKWKLPKNSILIFDEVHKCKNKKSKNGDLLLSAYHVDKVLLISATMSDKIHNFVSVGYLLGFYDDIKKGTRWMNNITNKGTDLEDIIKKLYPKIGSRMKISELGNQFPKNQIIAETYTTDDIKEIEASYLEISKNMEMLKKKTGTNFLGVLLKERQKIEELKIPIIKELAKDSRKSGLSVVIFVNFNDTIEKLSKELKTDCTVYGNQTMNQRNSNIDRFQSNKEKLIICNIRAGGESINLHDIHGGHQRISIINPSWSSIDLKQALGRIHRAEAKTPALQRLVFCSHTVEERICEVLNKKLKYNDAINDNFLEDEKTIIENLSKNH